MSVGSWTFAGTEEVLGLVMARGYPPVLLMCHIWGSFCEDSKTKIDVPLYRNVNCQSCWWDVETSVTV